MTQSPTQRRFIRLAGAMNAKAARLERSGRITPDDLAEIYLRAAGHCYYCATEVLPTMCSFDHFEPFVSGGNNHRRNLVLTCLTCNRTKAKRLAHEFAEARALIVQCEICDREFRPRYADFRRGFGRTCSAICAGTKGRAVRSAS